MAREQVKFMDDDENDFDLYDFDTNEQVSNSQRFGSLLLYPPKWRKMKISEQNWINSTRKGKILI